MTKMNAFQSRVQKFVAIFNIPLEKNWEKYLQKDHLNYYDYMVGVGITTPLSGSGYKETRLSANHPGLNVYLKKNAHYFQCPRMHQKVVVDVGCGWGFLAFWYLLHGASEVYALGFPYQIEFLDRLYKTAVEKNFIPSGSKLFLVDQPVSSGAVSLIQGKESFADMVTYNDVFEHLHDDLFDDALAASLNSLKPGGLLISATHNTDNARCLNRIISYWNKLEEDYIYDQRLKRIATLLPEFQEKEIKKLAAMTRGLTLKYFESAVADFKNTGKLPESKKVMPAVDLEYDYICENYLSPRQVQNKMQRAGFNSCIYYPALRHSRKFMIFWPFEKLLRKVFMRMEFLSQNVIFEGMRPS